MIPTRATTPEVDGHPSRAPIPPEVKAANRQRALALAAQAPALEDRPPVFAHWMRTVFIPKYLEVLDAEREVRPPADDE